MLYIKDNALYEPKKQEANNNTFMNDKINNNLDVKRYKILDPRKKSFNIFKKEEKREENNNSNFQLPKRKKTFTDDNSIVKGNLEGKNDSFAILGKINFISIKINLSNNEQITCDGECQFCKFIKIIVLDLFKREKKFNIFEKYMLNNYSETYLINNNLLYNLYI